MATKIEKATFDNLQNTLATVCKHIDNKFDNLWNLAKPFDKNNCY